MTRKGYIGILFIMLLTAWQSQCALAQNESSEKPLRPVASMFSAQYGHSSVLDSYLSPLKYGGHAIAINYEAQQATGFNPEKWTRQLRLGVDYDYTHNPAGNHNMHSLLVDASWGMMHRWKDILTPGLQLQLGGETQFRGGAVYNAYNSNNVVSARIHWNVGLLGQAVYNTHIKRLPITLRYQAILPVAGAFFAPDYDEAYYEIYLGNHSNLAHFGWWGNRFDLDHTISADLHLGNTILRIGYRNRINTSWINNINTRDIAHYLVIGIGGEFLNVGAKNKSKLNNNTISSIYQ
ncbi:MAG: DUF3316 domain-containing protein [Muribaculaceae bacterium]|nr:DUF3316 domain-containing protein [Muribaculaceae bacterium]